MQVQKFVFGPFAENTFIVYDDSLEALIIDPGCMEKHEEEALQQFVEKKGLKPVRLINTHCHIDHIWGNAFVSKTWGLKPEYRNEETDNIDRSGNLAEAMGLTFQGSPKAERFIDEDNEISFGNSTLKILFTPGHSPGHIALLDPKKKFIISADVVFQGSIGRTDLPGGNYGTLIDSIKNHILPLPDSCIIYCGHGPDTTVKFERNNNPFILSET